MISWVAMDRIVERKRAADTGYRKQAAEKVLRSDGKRLTDGAGQVTLVRHRTGSALAGAAERPGVVGRSRISLLQRLQVVRVGSGCLKIGNGQSKAV